jgi:hypothetical protein
MTLKNNVTLRRHPPPSCVTYYLNGPSLSMESFKTELSLINFNFRQIERFLVGINTNSHPGIDYWKNSY